MVLNKETFSKILYLFLGIFLALAFYALPREITLLLIAGVVGVIVSFKFLELSISAFVMLMTVIPHNYWSNMMFVAASIFYFVTFIIQVITEKRKGFKIRDLNIAILFFLFFGVYGVVIGYDSSDAFRIYLLLVSAILMGITVAFTFNNKKSINIFLDFVCISLVLTSLFGLFQKYSGIEIRAEFIDTVVNPDMPGRVFSSLDNPNNFAMYLCLFVPLAISHFFNCKNEIKKLILFCVVGLGVLLLLFTLSRGAYIGFAIGALLYLLIVNPKLVPFVILFGLLCIPFLPDFFISRVQSIGKDSSSSYRIKIWEGAIAMAKDYWYRGAGIGPNSFKYIFARYAEPLARRAMHSHNVFLQVLLEMGIGGFASFIIFLFGYCKKGFVIITKAKETKDFYYKNLIAGCFFGVVAFLAYGMVEYVWYYPRVMLSFWIVIGITYSTYQSFANESAQEK